MIDPKLLGDLARDHQKNVLTREEARAFLKDLMQVCRRHRVFLRTADQTIRYSKVFEDSDRNTVFRAIVDKQDRSATAQIDYK